MTAPASGPASPFALLAELPGVFYRTALSRGRACGSARLCAFAGPPSWMLYRWPDGACVPARSTAWGASPAIVWRTYLDARTLRLVWGIRLGAELESAHAAALFRGYRADPSIEDDAQHNVAELRPVQVLAPAQVSDHARIVWPELPGGRVLVEWPDAVMAVVGRRCRHKGLRQAYAAAVAFRPVLALDVAIAIRRARAGWCAPEPPTRLR